MGVMQGCYWVVDSIVPIVSNAFKFFKSVVRGYGQGKRLGTCLVLELRTSGVVRLQHVFNVLICWMCAGIDGASALVCALCFNPVRWVS